MKRMTVLTLAFILLSGFFAVGERSLVGSWERTATAVDGVNYENDEREKELWVFWPDGTWQLYEGNVLDYAFTDDRITISYEDPFSALIGYESRIRTKEYSYILDGDVLVLIYTVDERSIYMVHQRESGEGLFGRWNRVAMLNNEEDYRAWLNASTPTEEPVFEFYDFYADGKCVFWQGSIPVYDDWNEVPDLTLKYAVSGENLTLVLGNDSYEVGYSFEDDQLTLTFEDSIFDGEDWVNAEEKVTLRRVR